MWAPRTVTACPPTWNRCAPGPGDAHPRRTAPTSIRTAPATPSSRTRSRKRWAGDADIEQGEEAHHAPHHLDHAHPRGYPGRGDGSVTGARVRCSADIRAL